LCVLFLWLGTVSAYSGRAFGRDQPGFLLCGVIPHGKRGPKLTRLVAQPAHQPVGVVDPSGRHSHRASSSGACSSRDLDHGAHLDGDSVHSECEALRTHSLPLHWTLLSRHDRPRARARLGLVSAGFYGWLVLAVLILAGSKIIWWAAERAWGKFSYTADTNFFARLRTRPLLAVRPEGANHQWRRNPPGELSIDPVADERLMRVTAWVGAS
jgi:hypothetical protein